jgi:two-component system chemotaxis response regulator CheY
MERPEMTGDEDKATTRILVVEDSSSMRDLVSTALEAEGFEVKGASSGFQALKSLKAASYDLIVTDINMPDLTGLELIKFVRSSRSHADTPLLVISTDAQAEDRRRAMALGANDYLVKPFGMEELVEWCKKNTAGGRDPG